MQSGSARKRFSIRTLALAAVLLLVCPAVSLAAIPDPPPEVVTLLPKSGDVKGWEVYPNTLVYASGNGLTEIYDGGYELYTKNGVLEAAQQMYRCKNDTAIVTIHRMSSTDTAKSFFEYWQKSDCKQKTYKSLKLQTSAYVYTAEGAANSCLYRDLYFVTVSVYIDASKGQGTAFEFEKLISNAIGKLAEASSQPQQAKPGST